jgi:hypothetical protein
MPINPNLCAQPVIWVLGSLRDFCGIESCTVVHGTAIATSALRSMVYQINSLRSICCFRNARVGGSSPLSGTTILLSFEGVTGSRIIPVAASPGLLR